MCARTRACVCVCKSLGAPTFARVWYRLCRSVCNLVPLSALSPVPSPKIANRHLQTLVLHFQRVCFILSLRMSAMPRLQTKCQWSSQRNACLHTWHTIIKFQGENFSEAMHNKTCSGSRKYSPQFFPQMELTLPSNTNRTCTKTKYTA